MRDGDVRLMSWLTMGALKEVMFQIVQRGAEYDEDKLVEGAFAFFRAGCFCVPDAGVKERNDTRSYPGEAMPARAHDSKVTDSERRGRRRIRTVAIRPSTRRSR